MHWQVPKMWQDGECWIIGGGPSLIQQFNIPKEVVDGVRDGKLSMSAYSPYLATIHGKHIIAINTAFKLGNWVDLVFFGDNGWFQKNREDLIDFLNLKVACHAHFSKNDYVEERVKYIEKDRNHAKGISPRVNKVSWNHNSGAAAISLAVHLGCKKIILVGFDMKLDDKKEQHWHNQYRPKGFFNGNSEKGSVKTFNRHLQGFPVILKEAEKLGVEIINASPDSAIECFKKMSVQDILKEEKKMKPITVICVLKSGGDFKPSDVLRLQQMTERYITIPFEFVCLTDVEILGCKTIPLIRNYKGWWSKIELFRNDLVKTERIVYFDLDKIITGNIDDILLRKEDFIGLKPFNPERSLRDTYIGSAIMSWKNNDQFNFIYDEFRFAEDSKKFKGDQDYISRSFQDKKLRIDYWQDSTPGIYSYKRHCKKGLPKDAKIVCFHGDPRPNKVKVIWVQDILKEYNQKLGRILIQFPTRQRPEKFKEYLETYFLMASNKTDLQVHVSCDIDDLTMNNPEMIKWVESHMNTTITFAENKTKIEAVNRDIPKGGWDILLLASDDMLPIVEGYDYIIRKAFLKYFPNYDGVTHFNDGFWTDQLNTLSIIGRKYYERFGYIYHPAYKSFCCDNEFGDIAVALGKSVYIKDVIICHKKYSEGKKDDLYLINHKFSKIDQITYKNRKKGYFDNIVKEGTIFKKIQKPKYVTKFRRIKK